MKLILNQLISKLLISILILGSFYAISFGAESKEKKEVKEINEISDIKKYFQENYPYLYDYLSGQKKLSKRSSIDALNFNNLIKLWIENSGEFLRDVFNYIKDANDPEQCWKYNIIKEFESLWHELKGEKSTLSEEEKYNIRAKLQTLYYQKPLWTFPLLQYKNRPFMEIWCSAENEDDRDDAIIYLVNNVADKLKKSAIPSDFEELIGEVIHFIQNHQQKISKRFVLPLVKDQIKELIDTFKLPHAKELVDEYHW
jgi:hypothetical protein